MNEINFKIGLKYTQKKSAMFTKENKNGTNMLRNDIKMVQRVPKRYNSNCIMMVPKH